MNTSQFTGHMGECRVIELLIHQGYQIIETNFTVHHRGEIDIIAFHHDVIACVEVKTRFNTAIPFESLIPRSKQKKIIHVAQWFVQTYNLHDRTVRFDAAFVDMTAVPVYITYLENAFQV